VNGEEWQQGRLRRELSQLYTVAWVRSMVVQCRTRLGVASGGLGRRCALGVVV
jgi:hypothetical protein